MTCQENWKLLRWGSSADVPWTCKGSGTGKACMWMCDSKLILVMFLVGFWIVPDSQSPLRCMFIEASSHTVINRNAYRMARRGMPLQIISHAPRRCTPWTVARREATELKCVKLKPQFWSNIPPVLFEKISSFHSVLNPRWRNGRWFYSNSFVLPKPEALLSTTVLINFDECQLAEAFCAKAMCRWSKAFQNIQEAFWVCHS